MNFSDLLLDTLRTLWSHKLRTFLSMFGIAWGIISITLMVAAGEGLRVGQQNVAANFGKDIMIVFCRRTSLPGEDVHAGRDDHGEDINYVFVQQETIAFPNGIPELAGTHPVG